MLAALWAWFVGLFTKEKIGILFVMLFKAGVSAVAAQIADLDLQEKARVDYSFITVTAKIYFT